MAAKKIQEEEQKAKEEDEARKETQEDIENMLPAERVRRMLFNLVIECVPFTDDELAFVQDCLRDPEVRQQLAEFLQAFSSPRCVVDEGCL